MTDTPKIQDTTQQETREIKENPHDPDNVRPEDVVRLFYVHNVPIIPVVSKNNMLVGVLRKEDLISELSDIERVEKLKIDAFITKITRKMSFEDLLQYGKIKEFVVVNIFGVTQGTWPRLQLFASAEAPGKSAAIKHEVVQQKEEQVLDWLIYLILEHIPRPLYAVNKDGRTIFYNSHFEDFYTKTFDSEVNTEFVEKSLKDVNKNEMKTGKDGDDIKFFNKALSMNYEKVPLKGKGENVGFLIFCSNKAEISTGLELPGVDIRGMSLEKMMNAIERQLIVDAVQDHQKVDDAARSLKIPKNSLMNKIKKFNIKLNK